MSKTAVVTGAGSGVGRATALALAKDGWRVALWGRREDSLLQTAKLAGADGVKFSITACDVAEEKSVSQAAQRVLKEFGDVEVLVNSAAVNVPQRGLNVLSLDDYHAMIDTNLNGAFYCVQAFLPQMRLRGSGTIVNIVSDAGKQAHPKSGPGYAMSKFGLTGLNQAINAEERDNGIRACAIFPGDIDTPLLGRRPQPPTAEARKLMLQPEDIADCVMLAVRLPARALVEEILIRPK